MSAPAVELVGPKGYTHGWIYHGVHGEHVAGMSPEHHAILTGRRAKTSQQHRNAARLYEGVAAQSSGAKAQRARRLARFHHARARATTKEMLTRTAKPVAPPFDRKKALKGIRAAQAKSGATRAPVPSGPPAPVRSTFNRKKALQGIRRAQARAGATKTNQGLAAANAGPALELARHVPIDPKIKLGSGGRFKKMKAKLAARGARNPGALAAFIGRRAYGAKKFGALSHGHAHANTGLAVELAMPRYPKYPVSSPYDVLVIRGEDGSAIIRHRRGGYEIARIRHTDDGSWVAAVDGRDGTPHTRQRGALLEAIGQHNRSSGTPYHRPVAQTEPLQPPPTQTPLMAAYGIPAVRALATPSVGATDGPRATARDGGGPTAGLGQKGAGIYKKLRGRGFPHERAHNFARRAERKASK